MVGVEGNLFIVWFRVSSSIIISGSLFTEVDLRPKDVLRDLAFQAKRLG